MSQTRKQTMTATGSAFNLKLIRPDSETVTHHHHASQSRLSHNRTFEFKTSAAQTPRSNNQRVVVTKPKLNYTVRSVKQQLHNPPPPQPQSGLHDYYTHHYQLQQPSLQGMHSSQPNLHQTYSHLKKDMSTISINNATVNAAAASTTMRRRTSYGLLINVVDEPSTVQQAKRK